MYGLYYVDAKPSKPLLFARAKQILMSRGPLYDATPKSEGGAKSYVPSNLPTFYASRLFLSRFFTLAYIAEFESVAGYC